jgi:voltage-gated potassium channel
MDQTAASPHFEKVTWLQCITLVLSVYVLIAVFIETIVKLSPTTILLLDYIDSLICLVFLYDFFFHLYKAPSKRGFLKWGWLDFISSIPMLGIFRFARLARVIRMLRILRAFRSSKILITYLFQHRASGTLASVAMISGILVIFCSIAILHVETGPDSNIKTPSDALWWAITTVTTVGYGDKYPITLEGRAVAVILMIAGVGLFATFTAYISSFFLESANKKHESEITELIAEVRLLRKRLDSMAQEESKIMPNKDAP